MLRIALELSVLKMEKKIPCLNTGEKHKTSNKKPLTKYTLGEALGSQTVVGNWCRSSNRLWQST